jgi:two-component system, chemotaxis family, chemotaxis protein CheY
LQALEIYSLQPPDLVLLDMVMEGMHGIEVLQKLKELDPNARVVLATADVQLQTASAAKQAGALGLVKKPFQDNVILSAVENALSGGTHWS